jgi:O-antigen/teichoic acid export membrane protein
VSEVILVFNSAVRDVIFSLESSSLNLDRLGKASRVPTLVTSSLAFTVGVLSVWGIPWLFGDAFSPAVGPTLILLLAIVLGNPGSVAGAGLSARGRPELRSVSLLIAVVVNVALVIALVPPLGACGAAWATLAGNVVAGGMNIIFLRIYLGIPVVIFLGIRKTISFHF